MKIKFLIFFICICSFAAAQPKKTDSCFQINFLDFFELDDMDDFIWPPDQLDGLLAMDFSDTEKGKNVKTNFLIPFIMLQLKQYHPQCKGKADTAAFEKLKQIYFKIREQDISILTGKTITGQLEIIRNDFYEQVLNDSLLPYMSFTLDDGPFYGKIPDKIPDYKKGKEYPTDFGKFFITNINDSVFITVENKGGKHLWTRLLTRNQERAMGHVGFNGNEIYKNSLGYKMRLYAEGEVLKLYLKPDGSFRCYFHSW